MRLSPERLALRAFAAAAAVAGGLVVIIAAGDVVKVEGGAVSGVVDRGVRVFKGIPYAAPPVGALRWKPPAPIVGWSGVRDGAAFGSECPQTQYPAGSVYIRPAQKQSEDCLFLNVWTTAKAGDRTPVLVWIHGGALTKGSGISDTRDGVPLARKGIVLVSLNYRLGPLGYLAHPELTAESPQHSSGNYGVLDQIAALKWVQTNIAAFGGDPARVTIAGESAGSWSVNTLVATPLAKGLFIRAIGESGGRFDRTPHLTEDGPGAQSAEKVGLALAKAVGGDTLSALRAVSAEKLMEVAAFRTQENVDGWVLPDEIKTIFAQKKHNNVPVIVGSNANEMTSLASPAQLPKSMDDFRRRIAQQYGAMAADFETAYGVKGDADIAPAMLASARDTIFSLHMRTWARRTAAAGSKAYLYFFSHAPPSPRATELKAFHAGEIPYVFNVVPSKDPREAGFAYADVDYALADAMSRYWVNFVTTGDPNGKGLPPWPAYNPDTEPYLEFGDTIRTGTHLLKTELDFQERTQNARPAPPAPPALPAQSDPLVGNWRGTLTSSSGDSPIIITIAKKGDAYVGSTNGLNASSESALKRVTVNGNRVTIEAADDSKLGAIVLTSELTTEGNAMKGAGTLAVGAQKFDVTLALQRRPRAEAIQPHVEQRIDYFVGRWKFDYVGAEYPPLSGGSRTGTATFTRTGRSNFVTGALDGELAGKPYREQMSIGLDLETNSLAVVERRPDGVELVSVASWRSPIAITFQTSPVVANGKTYQLRRLLSVTSPTAFDVTEEFSVDGGPFRRLGNGHFTKLP